MKFALRSGWVAVLLACGTGCEWPWQRSELTLSSALWTDRIGAELRLVGVSAPLFGGCETHTACAAGIQAALRVPTAPAPNGARSDWAGERLVALGAEGLTLGLERSEAGLDVVGRFALHPSSALLSGEIGLWLEQGASPSLRGELWSLAAAKAPGTAGFTLDLSDAPARVALIGPGTPHALPLGLALPGLDRWLTSAGTIPPK